MANPRNLLADAWDRLDEAQHDELLALAMEMWQECLSASKGTMVKGFAYECKACMKRQIVDVPMEVPDIMVRAKAFAEIANQSHGKVPEVRHVEVDVGARTLEALESMSLRELAAVAGVEEAEWAELPPAA